jgi:DNA end-binding protein Ku
MAARKLFLRLSLVTVPVRLSPATSEADKVKFNQLNKATLNRVKQQLVDAETGDVVERSDIVKGYEFDSGRYVTVTDDELDALRIESSQVIDIEQTIAVGDLPPEYLEAPYFLAPDGQMADEAYAVIRDALAKTGRIGLGRMAVSSREYAVALRPEGPGLTITTLRSAEEIRQPEFRNLPAAPIEMVQLAESILTQKASTWDPARWNDRYQAALRELIEAKVKGLPAPEITAIAAPGATVVNLMDVLRRSVQQEAGRTDHVTATKATKKANGDRRQGEIKLPIAGGKKAAAEAERAPERPARGRRKAG